MAALDDSVISRRSMRRQLWLIESCQLRADANHYKCWLAHRPDIVTSCQRVLVLATAAVTARGGVVTPNRSRKHVFVNTLRTKRDIYTTEPRYSVSNALDVELVIAYKGAVLTGDDWKS